MKPILTEKRKRTRIDISQSTYEALKSVANDRRQPMAVALHDAVELLQWAHEAQTQESKVIAVGKGVTSPEESEREIR